MLHIENILTCMSKLNINIRVVETLSRCDQFQKYIHVLFITGTPLPYFYHLN